MKIHIFFIKSKESSSCPSCDGRLIVRDSKLRHVIRKESEEPCWYRLRRLKCKGCNKLHTELPDFMQPFKHYESISIQDTLDDKRDNYCRAEETTLYRWRSDWARAKATIEALLIACWMNETRKSYPLYHDSLLKTIRKSESSWLAFVMRNLISAGHRIHTQFAFCP